MNILVVCEGGNSRSVQFATILKTEFGHNAVAIGTMYALDGARGREPGTMLSRWADRIVFMAAYIVNKELIPQDCWDKIRVCELGQDVYGRGLNEDLSRKCHDFMNTNGLA
jgi:hypothetical protein